MKKTNLLLVLMLVLATLSSANAGQVCKANAYAAILLTDGRVYKSVEITDKRFVTTVQNWQECYEFAARMIKTIPSSITLRLGNIDAKGTSIETEATIFLKWEFNDGLFINTSGQITAHTEKFMLTPQKGNLRFLENGFNF